LVLFLLRGLARWGGQPATIAPEGTQTTDSTKNEDRAVLTQCDSPDPKDRPPAERINVALVPEVMEELKILQDRTRLSRTDITNRAITLYEFIDQQLRSGHEVLIREKCTGKIQTVLLQ
jgi:hypothetical protein